MNLKTKIRHIKNDCRVIKLTAVAAIHNEFSFLSDMTKMNSDNYSTTLNP